MRLLPCARIDVSTCACGHVCECQPLLTGTTALSDHIHPNPYIHPPLPFLCLQLHIWVFLPLTCVDRRAARSKAASLHSTSTHHCTACCSSKMYTAEQEHLPPLWWSSSFTATGAQKVEAIYNSVEPRCFFRLLRIAPISCRFPVLLLCSFKCWYSIKGRSYCSGSGSRMHLTAGGELAREWKSGDSLRKLGCVVLAESRKKYMKDLN